MEGIIPYLSFILALGFLFGAVGLVMWMIGRLRGRGEHAPTAHQVPAPQPLPQPAEETAAQQPLSSPARAEGRQLLSVLRTETGELLIQVRGLYYRSLREITDVEAREDALTAIKALFSSLGARPAQAQSSVEEAFLQQLQRRTA
ncbi:MAG: hypothetical protein N2508_10435, partial [Anaerolineae bacterium]|nr:hypothetical protein [Anaerolineae bacterium]